MGESEDGGGVESVGTSDGSDAAGGDIGTAMDGEEEADRTEEGEAGEPADEAEDGDGTANASSASAASICIGTGTADGDAEAGELEAGADDSGRTNAGNEAG
jgi:hypothetical protein